ncbi:hypothetical protein CCACVL1_21800 [Corchorus capsularis]|uniref:Uncharacterized protein n=1 Tax=Corchorus capsularis TaxID=210143 RepID=A0A1R3H204_COCAP|nr:hypothetical protein CCACVL1_21800 [Corchorus capsularis]
MDAQVSLKLLSSKPGPARHWGSGRPGLDMQDVYYLPTQSLARTQPDPNHEQAYFFSDTPHQPSSSSSFLLMAEIADMNGMKTQMPLKRFTVSLVFWMRILPCSMIIPMITTARAVTPVKTPAPSSHLRSKSKDMRNFF